MIEFSTTSAYSLCQSLQVRLIERKTMKRNRIFAATSLVLAGAAVGAGMMISGSAMAATDSSSDTTELTVGMMNDKGVVVECALSSEQASKFLGGLEAGVAPDGLHSIFGSTSAGSATSNPTDQATIEKTYTFSNVESDEGALSGATVVPTDNAAIDGNGDVAESTSSKVVNDYVVRVGTAEECSSVLK